MKKSTVVTAAAMGLTSAVLGFASPAVAAPAGNHTAQETISMLEAEGNRVIVNRLSNAPLAEAHVIGVHPGPGLRKYVWEIGDEDDDRVRAVVGRVYFVDVQ